MIHVSMIGGVWGASVRNQVGRCFRPCPSIYVLAHVHITRLPAYLHQCGVGRGSKHQSEVAVLSRAFYCLSCTFAPSACMA